MASKVKKGFLYYLMWLAFIVFGIACILGTILLFNPNKDVFGFGLKYVSFLNTETYNMVKIDGTDRNIKDLNITTFNINTKYADLRMVIDPVYTQITFEMNRKINGFSNEKGNSVCYLDFDYADGNTLNVNTVAPDFWLALGKNITITMYIPKTYVLNNKTFNIESTSGCFTPDASGSVAEMALGNLNIKTDSGKITLPEGLKITSGMLNVDCKNAQTYIYNNLTSMLNFKTDSGKLYVKKIAGNLNIEANKLDVKCDEVLGNISYSSKTGYIRVGKLGTNDTNGNFTAEIDKLHIADVIIEQMTGDLDIPNASASNITVTSLGGEALVETTSGNIKIGNAQKNVTLKTKSGSVNLTQTSETSKTVIETESGKIATNLTSVGNVSLKSEKGFIEINTATDLQYLFTYSTEKEITVSWIQEQLPKQGTISVGGATETCTSKINATTKSGKIALSDGFELVSE